MYTFYFLYNFYLFFLTRDTKRDSYLLCTRRMGAALVLFPQFVATATFYQLLKIPLPLPCNVDKMHPGEGDLGLYLKKKIQVYTVR